MKNEIHLKHVQITIKYPILSSKDSLYVTRALFEKDFSDKSSKIGIPIIVGFFLGGGISIRHCIRLKNSHVLALPVLHNKQHALLSMTNFVNTGFPYSEQKFPEESRIVNIQNVNIERKLFITPASWTIFVRLIV